jgi:hypothetical protein
MSVNARKVFHSHRGLLFIAECFNASYTDGRKGTTTIIATKLLREFFYFNSYIFIAFSPKSALRENFYGEKEIVLSG